MSVVKPGEERWGGGVSGSVWLSALVAGVVVGGVGVGLAYLCTRLLGNYGVAVFVVLPMTMGFATVVLYTRWERRGLGECLVAAFLGSMVVPSVGLLCVGLEGLVCIAMASVLWAPLGMLGGAVGYALQGRIWPRAECKRGFEVIVRVGLVLMLVPAALGFERFGPAEGPVRCVETVWEVNARPEVVWEHVVAMPPLPPPREWLFRMGIAHPVGTRIVGRGVGATRYCDLSTGAMAERVTAWEPGRRLAFDVLDTPPSMREWTFYKEVKPRHLDGYFTVERGEFELRDLGGGRTLMVGRSWYRTRIGPGAYWNWWCDAIVHAVHRRVFAHVSRLAEGGNEEARDRGEIGWPAPRETGGGGDRQDPSLRSG